MKVYSAIICLAATALAANAAQPLWERSDMAPASMALTPTRVLALNSQGGVNALDVTTGETCPWLGLDGVDRIGNSSDGRMWASSCDQSATSVTLYALDDSGAAGEPCTITTSQLAPEAYSGVKSHTFGTVTVDGNIADGTATVAIIERITASNQAETESLRLWRVYGCFDPTEEVTARYSDLCTPDQYPYVSIQPDLGTQVALTSLTTSITDNTGDVPYFYTSRSATQQATQRLTAPVNPAPGLTGIRLATVGATHYFIYASAPGEVTVTTIDEPANGFAADNIHFLATLPMSQGDATAAATGQVQIATLPIGGDLAMALYTPGRALSFYRLSEVSNGVEELRGDGGTPYSVGGTTIHATTGEVDIYDLAGRRVAHIPSGCAITLPSGVYVARTGAGAQIVALR